MPSPRRFRAAWGDVDVAFATPANYPFVECIGFDRGPQDQQSARMTAAYYQQAKDPHISWKDREENARLGQKLGTARPVIGVQSQNAVKITYRAPNAKQRKEQARLHYINLSYLLDNIAGAKSPYYQAKMVTPQIHTSRSKESQEARLPDKLNGRVPRNSDGKTAAGKADCGVSTAEYDRQMAQEFYDFAAEKLRQQRFSTADERTLWFAKLYHTNVAYCGHKTALFVVKQLSYGCDQVAILRAIESSENLAAK